MKVISELGRKDLEGKRVIVRVGFDVPVIDGVVENDFRIRESLATIDHLIACHARVIILSHIGRDTSATLAPVYESLRKYAPVTWHNEVVGDTVVPAIVALKNGTALLLENLRRESGETENDPIFAKTLASYGELYVNEAFSVAHRAHASIVGIPEHLPSYAGIGFMHEVEALSKAFTPTSPSIFVIGGAKFDTKLPLIKKFLPLYDRIFVCGALAHDLMLARGLSVGASLSSDVPLEDQAIITSEKVIAPVDVRVQSLDGISRIDSPRRIGPADSIMDAGPKSVEAILEALKEGGTMLWNGPLGWYERGYTDGTEALAYGVAESKVQAIVGGGDTVASIEKLGLNDRFTHVSTGGGAMLEFLEKGTLPGIDALKTA